MNRKFRFFFHYNKQRKQMTVHFKKQCIPIQNIECHVVCETKWKKTQPNLVMQGFCSNIKILKDKIIIY
jgi:predicted metal-dependent hydrolase